MTGKWTPGSGIVMHDLRRLKLSWNLQLPWNEVTIGLWINENKRQRLRTSMNKDNNWLDLTFLKLIKDVHSVILRRNNQISITKFTLNFHCTTRKQSLQLMCFCHAQKNENEKEADKSSVIFISLMIWMSRKFLQTKMHIPNFKYLQKRKLPLKQQTLKMIHDNCF